MHSRNRPRLSHGASGRQRVRCSVSTAQEARQEELLHLWWRSRGVFEVEQRRRLVELALQPLVHGGQWESPALDSSRPLPGIPSTWDSPGGLRDAEDVVEVSKRLLQLEQLLGGGGGSDDTSLSQGSRHQAVTPEELVFMVQRQPDLLTTPGVQVTRRLLEMRVATAGRGVDVVRMAVRQPALLTSDSWASDFDLAALAAASGAGPSNGNSLRPEHELMRAWEHGVTSDGAKEWDERLQQLAAYVGLHGDASVGYRDKDDRDLGRWAAKQRSDAKQGLMLPDREERLLQLGFQFDDDEAEWVRWHSELASFRRATGHCSPWPLAQGVDLRLINWASIQRIARRSRVLTESRIERLDQLDFEWTGADPLS